VAPAATETATATVTPTSICDQTARFPRSSPIPLGISGGNARDFLNTSAGRTCIGGTLGSLLEDSNNKQYILGTNHLLARNNSAALGEPIVQPGLQDTKCNAGHGNVVAKLSKFVPLHFAHNSENMVDAAIAKASLFPNGNAKVSSDILNIGGISSDVIAKPTVEMNVQEMGDGSCQTLGVVTALNVNVSVSYVRFNKNKPKIANFLGQIQISSSNPAAKTFVAAADIGSLIVTAPTDGSCPQPVALLFAVSVNANGPVGFATPVQSVLDLLNTANPKEISGLQFVNSCPTSVAAPAAPTIKGFSADAIQAATDTRDRNVDELMSIPEAIGTGVGIGNAPDRLAIIVYVKRLTPDQLAATPGEIEGVPVVLRETGEITTD